MVTVGSFSGLGLGLTEKAKRVGEAVDVGASPCGGDGVLGHDGRTGGIVHGAPCLGQSS